MRADNDDTGIVQQIQLVQAVIKKSLNLSAFNSVSPVPIPNVVNSTSNHYRNHATSAPRWTLHAGDGAVN